jgi:uncharacterized protein (TIGR00661 family)
LPDFFRAAFDTPVAELDSPGFAFNAGNKGVSFLGTATGLAFSLGGFWRSLAELGSIIDQTRPDLIINFFEPLTGLLKLVRKCPVPVLSVGHQFMMEHPDNFRARGFVLQEPLMRQFVRLVGCGSTRLALSYAKVEDLPEQRLYVCPPVLRSELFEQKPVVGDYLLVYLVNHGFAADVIRWHKANPSVPIHCFYDKSGAKPDEAFDATLTFHALDGKRFLSMMAGCRGVVCTAGFESVAEATYLGKPLLCIPLQNHVEQAMNAIEASARGMALRDTEFRMSRLLACVPPRSADFRAWVDSAETVLLRAMQIAVAPHSVSNMAPSPQLQLNR